MYLVFQLYFKVIAKEVKLIKIANDENCLNKYKSNNVCAARGWHECDVPTANTMKWEERGHGSGLLNTFCLLYSLRFRTLSFFVSSFFFVSGKLIFTFSFSLAAICKMQNDTDHESDINVKQHPKNGPVAIGWKNLNIFYRMIKLHCSVITHHTETMTTKLNLLFFSFEKWPDRNEFLFAVNKSDNLISIFFASRACSCSRTRPIEWFFYMAHDTSASVCIYIVNSCSHQIFTFWIKLQLIL